MTRPIVIDTDPGIDDAMAILYAAAHPGLELIGLTTVFGNVPVATATRNALVLAELAGRAMPVAEGAARPMVRAAPAYPDHVHGPEGLGDIAPAPPAAAPDHRPAARFLADVTAARPGEVTLCAIGPLTNLAEALALDPAIADRTAGVVVMGGAIECRGNATPHAETNIWCDPHAAAAVFAADWPVTLVGLDVTTRVTCSATDFAALAARAPRTGGFLARAAQFYLRFHRRQHGLDACHMHDPAALVALTDPGLFGFRVAPLRVTLDGPEAGRTVPDEAAATPPVRLALEVDAEAVRARFLDVIGGSDSESL